MVILLVDAKIIALEIQLMVGRVERLYRVIHTQNGFLSTSSLKLIALDISILISKIKQFYYDLCLLTSKKPLKQLTS